MAHVELHLIEIARLHRYLLIDLLAVVVPPGILWSRWPARARHRPEHRDKVFERFYRIDKARSREEGSGAGLGLAIARWAVERQGGRIELDSAPGAGSVFRIVLSTRN